MVTAWLSKRRDDRKPSILGEETGERERKMLAGEQAPHDSAIIETFRDVIANERANTSRILHHLPRVGSATS